MAHDLRGLAEEHIPAVCLYYKVLKNMEKTPNCWALVLILNLVPIVMRSHVLLTVHMVV